MKKYLLDISFAVLLFFYLLKVDLYNLTPANYFALLLVVVWLALLGYKFTRQK